MVDGAGRVKLLDFGIAKALDPDSSEYTSTHTNQQLGTVMYMSPEQVRSTRDVGPGTDIYSLGVVLWEMVMGRKPYDGGTTSTFDIQMKIVQEPLQGTGGAWDEVIAQATAKEPGRRFTECAAFHGAIQLVRQGNTYHHAQTANEGASSDKTVIDTSNAVDKILKDFKSQNIEPHKCPSCSFPVRATEMTNFSLFLLILLFITPFLYYFHTGKIESIVLFVISLIGIVGVFSDYSVKLVCPHCNKSYRNAQKW
jgi:serine/threonine protein kinase